MKTSETKIKFGTDGWRAEIARDFTFETVSRVAHAIGKVMKSEKPDASHILVGYDRRFLSDAFAQTASVVLSDLGWRVAICDQATPTPALSYGAKFREGCAGAIVITASHNPPSWNGVKFKETFGGSALPSLTEKFEAAANDRALTVNLPDPSQFQAAVREGKIDVVNALKPYLEALKTQVDLDLIRQTKFRIGFDAMYGSGGGVAEVFFKELGIDVVAIHNTFNPGFEGTPPEPVEKNLSELSALITKESLACGVATDGDADRLGALDESGASFSTQMILSVVYWHMLKNRGKAWSIARSASTTKMVDLIAEKYGQKAYETPVGFKFIAEKIIQGDAHIGGEESGGIGIVDHLPERDGILTALLLLEVQACEGKPLSEIYAGLCEEFRPYQFIRGDLHVSRTVMESALNRLDQNPPKEWAGREVDTLSRLDGFKFYFKDGGWLLIRPSGTEPIFRTYAEAESLKACETILKSAKAFIDAAL